jgi:hypothetical protein
MILGVLKQYAEKFQIGPAGFFLSGKDSTSSSCAENGL